jgi:tRNA(Ile2) C34 agmatinyltransferase TiaS
MFDFGDAGWLMSPEGAVAVMALADLADGECPKCGGSLEEKGGGFHRCGKCGTIYRAEG